MPRPGPKLGSEPAPSPKLNLYPPTFTRKEWREKVHFEGKRSITAKRIISVLYRKFSDEFESPRKFSRNISTAIGQLCYDLGLTPRSFSLATIEHKNPDIEGSDHMQLSLLGTFGLKYNIAKSIGDDTVKIGALGHDGNMRVFDIGKDGITANGIHFKWCNLDDPNYISAIQAADIYRR